MDALLAQTLNHTPRNEGEPPQDFITHVEKAAVKRSMENLMTFPCISTLVERGKLHLHGAYFGVARGSLWVLDQESGQFTTVDGQA